MLAHGVPESLVAGTKPFFAHIVAESRELRHRSGPLGRRHDRGGWTEPPRVFRPGHSTTDTLFVDDDSGDAFVGDHLLANVSSGAEIMPTELPGDERRRALLEYLSNLRKTEVMQLARCYPGHGPIIDDHRALIEERLAFHSERLDRIAGLVAEGCATAFSIARRLWSDDVAESQPVLVVWEVLGHLDILVNRGTIREDVDERGHRHFRPKEAVGRRSPIRLHPARSPADLFDLTGRVALVTGGYARPRPRHPAHARPRRCRHHRVEPQARRVRRGGGRGSCARPAHARSLLSRRPLGRDPGPGRRCVRHLRSRRHPGQQRGARTHLPESSGGDRGALGQDAGRQPERPVPPHGARGRADDGSGRWLDRQHLVDRRRPPDERHPSVRGGEGRTERAHDRVRRRSWAEGARQRGDARPIPDRHLEELGSQAFAERAQTFPLRRAGDPDELSSAVLYFASDASSFTTGAVLAVDGGAQWSLAGGGEQAEYGHSLYDGNATGPEPPEPALAAGAQLAALPERRRCRDPPDRRRCRQCRSRRSSTGAVAAGWRRSASTPSRSVSDRRRRRGTSFTAAG